MVYCEVLEPINGTKIYIFGKLNCPTEIIVFETPIEAEYMCIDEIQPVELMTNIIERTDEYEQPLKSDNSNSIKVSSLEYFILEAVKTDSFKQHFQVF